MREVNRNSRKRILDGNASTALIPEWTAPINTSPLCERCSELDLEAISKKNIAQKGYAGMFFFNLPDIKEESKCALCLLFVSMRLPAQQLRVYREGEEVEYCVRAFSAIRLRLPQYKGGDLKDTAMLGVVPTRLADEKFARKIPAIWNNMDDTGYIYPLVAGSHEHSGLFSGRVVDPLRVNYDAIRNWISFCKEHHLSNCGNSEGRILHGFKVIDCFAREVVPAPEAVSYVALSYVWGNAEVESQPNDSGLPHSLPPTIEDSITMVKELGLRYLWIDRYCIPQDGETKHDQIQGMNLVYKNAELTIIALAGRDPSYGLPGVGGRSRLQQPQAIIGQTTLVSSLPSLQSVMAKSTWASRGWTYQEGVMSRRRLIFTEYQVYFECMGMHCQESISIPLKTIHTRDMQGFKQSCHRLRAFPSHGVGRHSVQILDCIEDYSRRSLTYDSDAINAFSGILRSFEKEDFQVQNFWGIPVFPTHRKQVQWTAKGDSFSTKGDPQLVFGLIWTTARTARRRPDFPSWSWAGWANIEGLKFRKRHGTANCFWTHGEPDAAFWVELKSGKLVPWEKFLISTPFNSYTRNASQASRFLHIEAWTIPVTLKYFPTWENIFYQGHQRNAADPWSEDSKGSWALKVETDNRWWPVQMTRELDIEKLPDNSGAPCSFEAVFLNGTRDRTEYVMVVVPVEDHFERVAVAWIGTARDRVNFHVLERRRIRLG